MDNIRQEKSNEGPILKVNKRKTWQSLNKKFGTHIEKFMVFKTMKKKKFVITRNKVISGNTRRGLKT